MKKELRQRFLAWWHPYTKRISSAAYSCVSTTSTLIVCLWQSPQLMLKS